MKKIVVLGGGESGCGAAVLAKQKGFQVFVSDKGNIKEKYKKVLNHHKINWEENQHSNDVIFQSNEVIKSPGIPDSIPILRELNIRKIPVISEIEFAYRYCNSKIISITGSNGKTTTSLLLGHILKKAGLNVAVAGNIGESFAMKVANELNDIYVLELSSFQLDGVTNFKSDIAILLNITKDHLDRYNNQIHKYIKSKFRISMNLKKSDHFIYCADDLNINSNIASVKSELYPFSIKKKQIHGAYLDDDEIKIKINKKLLNMNIQTLALQGKHNIYNSMAAAIAARILDIKKDVIRESLVDFKNVEHRLERVVKIHGVEYINDSKATNINSTWYALESMTKPTIWIVGGIDKGNDYNDLYHLVSEKVIKIICLGPNFQPIHDAFKDKSKIILNANNMQEAVNIAYDCSKKGDAVLLSPACASFDLFDNYEDRGRQFKELVRKL